MTAWAYALLALAIAAVWCPPVPVGGRAVPAWPALFAAAVAVALMAGVLSWPALPALAALLALAWAATGAPRWRPLFLVATALLAVALSVHALPGFHNPKVIDTQRLSADTVPFTQYLNFDKGAAGLVLLAAFLPRARGAWLVTTLGWTAATATAVMGSAWAQGLVHPDPKWLAVTPTFLAVNLLFTCVAEEAFFRGVLQRHLPGPRPATVVVSAALFGLVHLPGGAAYALLATLLGLGAAWVYERTGRIESAIALHFGVNAVHFIGFSYPMLAKP